MSIPDKNPSEDQTPKRKTSKDKEPTTGFDFKVKSDEEIGDMTGERKASGDGSRHGKPFQYKKGDLLDSDNDFADVWECLDMNTGERLAIKTYEINENVDKIREEVEFLQEEFEILQDLDHKNLIRYYDIEISETEGENTKLYVQIIMEYASGGSIWGLLKKFNALDERVVQFYTHQILESLSYLHSEGIVHGNLKGSNILIDANGIIKLSDLEFTNRIRLLLEDIKRSNEPRDSIYWTAPELLRDNKLESKADIWSLGCVILEMLTGKLPWGSNKREAYNNILSGSLPFIPEEASTDCKDFLKKTFQFRQEERPTAAELLEHPFVSCINNNTEASFGESLQTFQSLTLVKANGLLQSLNSFPKNQLQDSMIDSPNKINILQQQFNFSGSGRLSPPKELRSPADMSEHPDNRVAFRNKLRPTKQKPRSFLKKDLIRNKNLPQVFESNIEDEELSPALVRRSAADWLGGPVKNGPDQNKNRLVEVLYISEEVKVRKVKTQDPEGEWEDDQEDQEDHDDNKLNIQQELYDHEPDRIQQMKKAHMPIRLSSFQKTYGPGSNLHSDERHERLEYSREKEIDKSKHGAVNKQDERRRIEEEMMKELMRIQTKDLHYEDAPSFEEESSHGIGGVVNKEKERKKIEEEMMKELMRIQTKDLHYEDAPSFEEESPHGIGGVVNKEKERKRIEEEMMKELMRIRTKDLHSEDAPSFEEESQHGIGEVVSKEEERKRIEEEMMRELMRIQTKDLKNESLPLEERNSVRKSKVLSKEEERRRIEEEMMKDLLRIQTKDLQLDNASSIIKLEDLDIPGFDGHVGNKQLERITTKDLVGHPAIQEEKSINESLINRVQLSARSQEY